MIGHWCEGTELWYLRVLNTIYQQAPNLSVIIPRRRNCIRTILSTACVNYKCFKIYWFLSLFKFFFSEITQIYHVIIVLTFFFPLLQVLENNNVPPIQRSSHFQKVLVNRIGEYAKLYLKY